MVGPRGKILILGGTVDARLLASTLVADGRWPIVTSLAGRTRDPRIPEGEVRIGGFGGAEGLQAYLQRDEIAAVIDATHPFAETISSNAVEATQALGLPLLALSRPAWQAVEGDQWHRVATMEEAIQQVPKLGKRPFLTVGVQEVDRFLEAAGKELHYVVRLIEPRNLSFGGDRVSVIVQKPPFRAEVELTLCQEHAIDLVITKNSGGTATYGKIQAARQLGLPVLMIDRPDLPPRDLAETIPEALNWLEDQQA